MNFGKDILLNIYKSMALSRAIDVLERSYTQRGQAFFHVSGAGHEASACLGPFLKPDDWLSCHYRDKALMLYRGITALDFFRGFFTKGTSHSAGRQMSAHLSAPHLNVMSIVGPVGNNALHCVGVADAIRTETPDAIVLCSMGEGTTQQGEVMEAMAHASRKGLPVLFLVENNRYAISTKTEGKTFFHLRDGRMPDEFLGIPIIHADGREPSGLVDKFAAVVSSMREKHSPIIVVLNVERLSDHTNADDHNVYRSQEEIKKVCVDCDPIANFERFLLKNGIRQKELDDIKAGVEREAQEAAEKALSESDPRPCFDAKKPLDIEAKEQANAGEKPLTMLEAIRETLRWNMAKDGSIVLFGEDLEDPKGDVFGVTRGLTEAFPGRVENSPLSESTIVGVSIGRALAGKKPVGFLQFADFLPLAYNQIYNEMGSMYWRTNGGWECPVVLMVSCGGYRPGLGPFHGSSMESIAAAVPGIDVVMPSTAADAAGLLNFIFKAGRPAIFFYPKNCLNDRLRAAAIDVSSTIVPLGKARLVREGSDITIVSWGNGAVLSEKAAEAMVDAGISCEVIDLRSISPWDKDMVLSSVRKTGRLIVVDEDPDTVNFASEVAALVAEHCREAIIRRITRCATYVPCNFENQLEVLPSYRRIVNTICDVFGIKAQWDNMQAASDNGFDEISAVGSSPSDERVTIVKWHIKEGDEVKEGQVIAETEADKALSEINSPIGGVVKSLLVQEGESVEVGKPIALVDTGKKKAGSVPLRTRESFEKPNFVKKADATASFSAGLPLRQSGQIDAVRLVDVEVALGSRKVLNNELEQLLGDSLSKDIKALTGIQQRYWVDEGENSVTLALSAVKKLVEKHDLSSLSAIITATGTPNVITPSVSCQIHNALKEVIGKDIMCLDISAACSGYLYGLDVVVNYLSGQPKGATALLVTTETLSLLLDKHDPMTAPLFGDAASASLFSTDDEVGGFDFFKPFISASGEDGSTLSVPTCTHSDYVRMNGYKVFPVAVRSMVAAIEQVLNGHRLSAGDIDLFVPHQANQRIIDAIQKRLDVPKEKVFSNIERYGNTSSTSIPLCIYEILKSERQHRNLLFFAFGGGFTYGAALAQRK